MRKRERDRDVCWLRGRRPKRGLKKLYLYLYLIESPSSIASGESGREADGGPGEEDCSRSIGCKRGRDEGGNKTYEEAVLVDDGDHHVPVGVVG
jgi:hypothetical protein